MSDNTDPDDLAEGLRKWLEAGHLNDPGSVPETINIAQMKRKAAQRIMAAQRAQSNFNTETDDADDQDWAG
jgi:hypothetical protein